MRLEDKFKQLRRENRKAFIGYVPFGFPDIKATKGICLSLEEAGVDILELGLPFSDPLADGPIIQKATTQAIAKGANISNFLKSLKELKKSLKIPVVIMSYYNPIFNFGLERFLKQAKASSACAMILVDVPLEESREYVAKARKYAIDPIFFITPTTTNSRARKIIKAAKGFIYYISVTGITGPRDLDYKFLASHIKSVKRMSKLPVCVGFGVHKKEQVLRLNKLSDGVIVGSAIVKFIENNYSKKDFLPKLKVYARSLCMKSST